MDKKFFWIVREIENDYGTMYNIGMQQEDLDKLNEAQPNDKGFRNMTLKKSKKWSWYIEINQEEKKEENTENSIEDTQEEAGDWILSRQTWMI